MRTTLAATLIALTSFLLPIVGWAAGGEEAWSAESKTAMSITGDIRLSPTRLTLSTGVGLPLRVAADIRNFGANGGPVAARILAVTQPANPSLIRGNRLCEAPVRWIVVWRIGRDELGMAVFSDAAQPVGESSAGLCGTFTYSRDE